MTGQAPNPAVLAAIEAQTRVNTCLDNSRSFRLEAGAGAGKTYSLVEVLKKLIAERGEKMLRNGQQVACITFTEVARDEILQDIEQHPAILVETIHAFSWSVMSQFQKPLRELVAALPDRQSKIDEAGGLNDKPVEYQLGFFGVEADRITLSHDDIPRFMGQLLEKKKFRDILSQQYPVILIDEYQDTDKHFMTALTTHFLQPGEGPLIGLFGDHWQTIYRGDYELLELPNVEGVDKGSNFRSVPAIVNVLNALRPELPQEVSEPDAIGEARFFHANSYTGERTDTAHSKEDLPDDVARQYRDALTTKLQSEGWGITPENTKYLMLTHNALAAEQGYPSIAKIFKRNEAFAKKEDPTIAFLADVLEPMMRAYERRCYGEMFRLIKSGPKLASHADKTRWRKDMDVLQDLRLTGSIGNVLDHLKASQRPRLPDRIMRREEELAAAVAQEAAAENQDAAAEDGDDSADDVSSSTARHRQLREVRYTEVIELVKFLDGDTTFATQHSVKGAEFENVVVILGGGWNHYNWPRLLELIQTQALNSKNAKGYYRARNLFYVAISRPQVRLAVLATQTLPDVALQGAIKLFGPDHVAVLNLPE